MIIKTTSQLINTNLKGMILGGILGFLLVPILAEAADDTRTSKSISFSSTTEIDKASKDALLEQADTDTNESLLKHGFRPESNVSAVIVGNTSYLNEGEIWIYNASTELISDFDGDEYYHRFSVTIDADTVYDTSYVYVELYLSYEGGPWNHYASSDAYHIYGDSGNDAFSIETELGDGFPPGYYDVRIELYNADTDVRVLNYGPYDDASLSTLPLEDSYYDDEYADGYYPIETEVVIAGTGSMSWWLLAMPVILMLVRRLSKH